MKPPELLFHQRSLANSIVTTMVQGQWSLLAATEYGTEFVLEFAWGTTDEQQEIRRARIVVEVRDE